MSEYFRGYFDVYIISLAVMKERQTANQVVHEGMVFVKELEHDGRM